MKDILAIDKALEIGRSTNNAHAVGTSLTWKGKILSQKNELDPAMLCFDEAEGIFLELRDSGELAKVYNGKGIVLRNKNKREEAIEYQYKAAAIFEKLGMMIDAAVAYNSIANIHNGLEDDAKAVEMYEKVIALVEGKDRPNIMASVLINLASNSAYPPEKKLKALQQAEKVCLKNGYNRILGYVYSVKAEYYEKNLMNVDSQKVYFQKAIDYALIANDPYMVAFNRMYLGILETEDNPKEAEKKIRLALEDEYIQSSDLLRAEANLHLSKSLYQQSHYEPAYVRLDTAMNLYKAVYDEKVATVTAEASTKYETSQKEAQLTEQELKITQQQSQQNSLVLTGLFLLALTVAVFQYFFYRQKKRKQEVELALQVEQTEAERLKGLDEMKTRFFTNISHELRTPLSLIISPLEEVLKKLKQVNLEPDLQLAHRNSQNLLGLVNEVLDLAKLEAGKLEMEKSEVELLPFLRRVFYSFQSAADLKQVALKFDLKNMEGLFVKTDVAKLEKVLNNLVSNALKFSSKGGEVKIEGDFLKPRSPSPGGTTGHSEGRESLENKAKSDLLRGTHGPSL